MSSDGVLHFQSIPSTQDYALELVQSGRRDVWAVIADEQSAGRGRREASWFSPRGDCLAASFILWDTPIPALPWELGMRMAAALARLIRHDLGEKDLSPLLRWPNDVLIGNRKIGGVLVETFEGIAVIGVGVNLNTREFPSPLASIACSLFQLSGRESDPEATFHALWKMYRKTDWLTALKEFRTHDATTGKRFCAYDGRGGIALGIDELGLLRIRWDDGKEETIPAAQPI